MSIFLIHNTDRQPKAVRPINNSWQLIPLIYGVIAVFFFSATSLLAATYHVSPSGKNSNTGTVDAPFRTLRHATNRMAGGDSLIVGDGTYIGEENQIGEIPNGTPGQYTLIQAEHPFLSILEGTGKDVYQDGHQLTPIRLINNSYIQIKGLKIKNSPTGGAIAVIASHHIKLLLISIINGTRFDDQWGSPIVITNGSHHVLLEDAWITGAMRDGVLVYGNNHSDSNKERDTTRHVILRRVVVRWDYAKTHEPKAGIAFYGADDFAVNGAVIDSVCQNCIVLDLNPGEHYYNMYGAYYNPKTTQNISYYGSIALNIKGATTESDMGGFFIADNYDQNNGHKLIQSVAWDITGPAVRFSKGDPNGFGEINQSTLGNSNYGVFIGGEPGESRLPIKIKNSLLLNNKEIYSSLRDLLTWSSYNLYFPISVPHLLKSKLYSFKNSAHALTSDAKMKYLTRIEADSPAYHSGESGVSRGATILYRYGESGTLWGEPGWDTLTTKPLWPWPYQDQIKADFSEPNYPPKGAYPPINNTRRGFCAKDQTLTKYIWEYLGNPIPALFEVGK